jgi:hypothetical protein
VAHEVDLIYHAGDVGSHGEHAWRAGAGVHDPLKSHASVSLAYLPDDISKLSTYSEAKTCWIYY